MGNFFLKKSTSQQKEYSYFNRCFHSFSVFEGRKRNRRECFDRLRTSTSKYKKKKREKRRKWKEEGGRDEKRRKGDRNTAFPSLRCHRFCVISCVFLFFESSFFLQTLRSFYGITREDSDCSCPLPLSSSSVIFSIASMWRSYPEKKGKRKKT